MMSIAELPTVQLPSLDGYEVAPGINIIGEVTPIPGTNRMRALVNYLGALAVAELSIKFAASPTKGQL